MNDKTLPIAWTVSTLPADDERYVLRQYEGTVDSALLPVGTHNGRCEVQTHGVDVAAIPVQIVIQPTFSAILTKLRFGRVGEKHRIRVINRMGGPAPVPEWDRSLLAVIPIDQQKSAIPEYEVEWRDTTSSAVVTQIRFSNAGTTPFDVRVERPSHTSVEE